MIIQCIKDTETIRYGFLWLKKKEIKIKGLTTGKTYRVYNRHKATYRSGRLDRYSIEFYYIIDDNGDRKYYDKDLFIKRRMYA